MSPYVFDIFSSFKSEGGAQGQGGEKGRDMNHIPALNIQMTAFETPDGNIVLVATNEHVDQMVRFRIEDISKVYKYQVYPMSINRT